MATTMCMSGGALLKAGANVSDDMKGDDADANWTTFINQAESEINAISRVNWIDLYATLTDDVKKILEEYCSNLAGMYGISYDMSGYTSREEAGKMLDVLRDANTRLQSLLRDAKVQTFIQNDT